MAVFVRRRPLLRAAAIGGGAYFAGNRRMQLNELAKLHAQGVLSDEEFALRKARLLGS
jgi:hypothetical protein